MFASHRPAASYRKLDLETAVAQADPHALVAMLYDGALAAIARARSAIADANEPALRGSATTRALRILEEGLKASLDPRGGEITSNLRILYDHMILRLLSANAHADDAAYAEVAAMLQQLREAWHDIAPQARRVATAA